MNIAPTTLRKTRSAVSKRLDVIVVTAAMAIPPGNTHMRLGGPFRTPSAPWLISVRVLYQRFACVEPINELRGDLN